MELQVRRRSSGPLPRKRRQRVAAAVVITTKTS
jgi:hypothetical protein